MQIQKKTWWFICEHFSTIRIDKVYKFDFCLLSYYCRNDRFSCLDIGIFGDIIVKPNTQNVLYLLHDHDYFPYLLSNSILDIRDWARNELAVIYVIFSGNSFESVAKELKCHRKLEKLLIRLLSSISYSQSKRIIKVVASLQCLKNMFVVISDKGDYLPVKEFFINLRKVCMEYEGIPVFEWLFQCKLNFDLNVVIEGKCHDVVQLKDVLRELIRLVEFKKVGIARVFACDDFPFPLCELNWENIDVNKIKQVCRTYKTGYNSLFSHYFKIIAEFSCLEYSNNVIP